MKKITQKEFEDIIAKHKNNEVINLSNIDFREIDFSVFEQLDFPYLDLSDSNFSGRKLKNIDFSYCNLKNAIFDGASMDHLNFYGADLSGAILTNLKCTNTTFVSAKMYMVNLCGSSFSDGSYITKFGGAMIQSSIMSKCNFNGCSFDYADLSSSILVGADMSHASLLGVNFYGCNIRQTNFHCAILCNSPIFSETCGNQPIYQVNGGLDNFYGAYALTLHAEGKPTHWKWYIWDFYGNKRELLDYVDKNYGDEIIKKRYKAAIKYLEFIAKSNIK